MATIDNPVVYLQCWCGVEIPVEIVIALVDTPEADEDGTHVRQMMTAEPDMTEVWAHSMSHDTDAPS